MPKMPPHLRMVIEAFWEIHPIRFSQMGRRPLNIGDVLLWCNFHNIDDVDFRRWMWFFIRRIDSAWLEHAEEEDRLRRQQDKWMKED